MRSVTPISGTLYVYNLSKLEFYINMRIKYLTIYLLTINLLISADSDGDGIDDHVDEGKMVFHAAAHLGRITYSDFGGSSEAEELLSDLSKATIYWYGEFNQADLNKYTNNVNLHRFEMSDSQKAYIEISGTGDNSLDGIHYIDEYWGELYMLSQSDWGEIYFQSQVNINGNNLTIESPRFRFSQNILDSKLESIIGLPYTIASRSISIDLMMAGESFTHAMMMVDPLGQGASIYYTSLADVEGYTAASPISLIASPDSDSDGVTNAFDIYPNDSSQTLGTDSDGDGIDDHVDAFPSAASAAVTIMKLTENGYAKMSDISDLREGSVMIEVIDGIATLDLEMEVTNNLDSDSWTEVDGAATMSIPADTSTKFFRFKMAD